MSVKLSKRLRFEVLKRDMFTCQYCGKRAPEVALEVDHIHPQSRGGSNGLENLRCACLDCNRGKGAAPLNLPELHLEAPSIGAADPRLMDACQELWNYWWQTIERDDAVEVFHDPTIRHFFKKNLYLTEMEDAIDQVALEVQDRGMSAQDAWRYFCALCWNQIREQGGR